MSNLVKNLYPLCLLRISHMIGSGYCFLLAPLFNSRKSLTQRTLPSFLGVINVGEAHSLKGITDKGLDAVWVSILAAPASYTTFTAVQKAYVNFKLTQKASEPPKARQVASMRAGRRAGAPRCSGGGRG